MKRDWTNQPPTQDAGPLEWLADASKRLLQQRSLFLPGSSISVKTKERNLFGEEEEVLYVSRFDRFPEAVEPEDIFAVLVEPLARLEELDRLADDELRDYVERHGMGTATLPLCREALLHALVPDRCVVHLYPDAMLAIANTPSGMTRLREIYADAAVFLPYVEAGLPLTKACADALSGGQTRRAGLVLMQQGILAFGATVEEACERALELAARAENELVSVQSDEHAASPDGADPSVWSELPGLRQVISERCGYPVILNRQPDPAWRAFARRPDLDALAGRGPVPGGTVGIEWRFLRRENLSRAETIPVPGVVIGSEVGLAAFGGTAAEARMVADVYGHARDIIRKAEALETYQPLGPDNLPEGKGRSSRAAAELGPFAGEITLVTGAASGIGRGCVDAFLARGAAVVGLDIDPAITEMIDRADFLGLVCDVTEEEAISEALSITVETFGGLDMLVPNAGMFPPGRRIDALSRDEWDRVMEVNLDANLALMREAYPLLKASPKGGRVVIIGSRNVPAPGPGAVAYSVSKAGLVQMARVAALEWGGDGIRVNISNPHAVFDTGIWTDEVLQARADHYGLTVEQYKTRNVLGVEVTSRDVGELVAEMCGPLFDKTTGAQIPIDGGSERVV